MGPFLGPLPSPIRDTVSLRAAAASVDYDRVYDWRGAVCLFGNYWLNDRSEVLRVTPGYERLEDRATATLVEDGPEKVSIIKRAAFDWPELTAWLPTRPTYAIACPKCGADSPSAWCNGCGGLGWTFDENKRDLSGCTCETLVALDGGRHALLDLSGATPITWFLVEETETQDRWRWFFLDESLLGSLRSDDSAPGSCRIDLTAQFGIRGKKTNCWRISGSRLQARLEFADGSAVVFDAQEETRVVVRFEEC